jgi:hypothetical protein
MDTSSSTNGDSTNGDSTNGDYTPNGGEAVAPPVDAVPMDMSSYSTNGAPGGQAGVAQGKKFFDVDVDLQEPKGAGSYSTTGVAPASGSSTPKKSYSPFGSKFVDTPKGGSGAGGSYLDEL